jgi:AcrR family transcriptional regulator
MNSELKTEKARKTCKNILDSAKTVFIEKGFNQVSVKDIAAHAGLGHGTFYLYFSDKKDVFYKLLEQVEDDLYTAFQGGVDIDAEYKEGLSTYRALRKDIAAIFESFKRNYNIIRLSKELASLDPQFAEKYYNIRLRLIERTERIIDRSPLQKHVDSKIAAVAIAGMIESTAEEWLNLNNPHRIEMDFDRLLSTISKMYFKLVS